MKKSEFKKILLESVREVVKEDNVNLDELDFGKLFKYTPPTDEQIDAYLRSRPKDKALLDKDPERKEKWISFVKTDKDAGKAVKAKEVVFSIWDPEKKEFKARSGVKGSTSPTSFGEGHESDYKPLDNSLRLILKKFQSGVYDIEETIKWIKTFTYRAPKGL